MNFNEISNRIMKGENIHNINLRVCYYARVSTDSDVQLNSLDNQLTYYENYIKNNPHWIFMGGYIEEGVSGVRVDKRENFLRMIKDASLDKFDLIITKEVSRFARDLEDSIHYIRKLKDYNVGVLFENQNLNTFDFNSELILNIMFNLAQEESKKLSQRVKFGHKQAMSIGHVLGSSNITGYKKDNCKLVIVKEEAEFIKKLFELYATGEYGLYKLSKKLKELGYYNKKGKPYDKDTLKKMLENPKYKGYYRARVHETIDYRTKKRKTNPIEKQIIKQVSNTIIPPIVSEELWDRVNKILLSRKEKYQNNNNWSGGLKYAFSSKIYCKDCNCTYQHSHGNKKRIRPIWVCGNYLQYRIEECKSPIIAEKDLYNIMKEIIDKLIPKKNKNIKYLISLYEKMNQQGNNKEEIDYISEKISRIEQKKSKILELVMDGILAKEDLQYQFNECKLELEKLNKQQEKLNYEKNSINNKYSIKNILTKLETEINHEILESYIRKYVNKMIVSKIDNDRYNLQLDIYLKSLVTRNKKTPIVLLEKETISTVETNKRSNKSNKFTYNVYLDNQ